MVESESCATGRGGDNGRKSQPEKVDTCNAGRVSEEIVRRLGGPEEEEERAEEGQGLE